MVKYTLTTASNDDPTFSEGFTISSDNKMPPGTPHTTRRPANTIGIVLESVREPNETDTLQWYCEKCNHLLFEKSAHLEVLERDMPPIFEAYYAEKNNQECNECGYVNPGRPIVE